MDRESISWLLQSDPTVNFQTKRDLLKLPEKYWEPDRNKSIRNGWVHCLLDLQDDEGTWAKGYYGPKFTSTHYTLLLLRRFEVPLVPKIELGCSKLIKINAIGNISDTDPTKIDACITGMGLSILAYFGVQQQLYEDIFRYLQDNQLEDGGWNCRYGKNCMKGVNHSSMHTTLSVLEGLRELSQQEPKYRQEIENMQKKAHEFLLIHELYKSHTTGIIIDEAFIDISFPPRWKYNILSVLDYFRSVDFEYDERMADALQIIHSKERNGKWFQGKQMSGKTFFSTNISRMGSPFNTLRALRVLQTYNCFE